MAWHWIVDKLLSEAMMDYFVDEYTRHSVSMSYFYGIAK